MYMALFYALALTACPIVWLDRDRWWYVATMLGGGFAGWIMPQLVDVNLTVTLPPGVLGMSLAAAWFVQRECLVRRLAEKQQGQEEQKCVEPSSSSGTGDQT